MRKALSFLLPLTAFAVAAAPAPDFTIGGQPFTQKDFVDARAIPDMDGGAAIMLTLAPAAAKRLASLTAANVGKALPVALDGKVLVTPMILAPITEGVMEIGSRFGLPEAEAMAKRISGRDPVPDSLDQ